MLKAAVLAASVGFQGAVLAGDPQVLRAEDWETTVADDGAGSLAFRAMTLEESHRPEALVLALDRLPGQCDDVLISMAVVSDSPHGLPGGLLSPGFFGEMQIDKRSARHFDYRFLTDPNFENVILVQLTKWDGGEDLLRELRTGNTWRFRLALDGEVHSWRFSLLGVSAVLDRTRQDCLAHHDEQPEQVPAQAMLGDEYSL